MRETAGRRMLMALFFALAAGVLVYFYNPLSHFRADLRADGQGIRLTLEIAEHAIENVRWRG